MRANVRSKMGSLRRVAPFASLLTLAACSGVIGIENLNEGPRPGSGGSSGSSNSSGGDAVSAGGDAQPQAGNGHGGSNAVAGTSSTNEAGEGGMAGAGEVGGSGGSGGSSAGGTGGGTSGTVTGHVIDFRGHAVSGAPVEIGGKQAVTDAQGTFTIASVSATYDASLVIEVGNDPTAVHGYVFQGLTRRDPTLQIFIAQQAQDDSVDVNVTGSTLTAGRTLSVAISGPDGESELADITPDPNFSEGDAEWRGGSTEQENAYGLIWQADKNGLPASYVAYDTQPIALDSADSKNASVTLSLAAQTILTTTIGGTVTTSGTDTRANYAFIQFPSNGTITLANDTGPNTFSYVMPNIKSADFVVAATAGDAGTGQFSLVHHDFAQSAAPAILALPIPVSHVAVAPAASVDKVDGTVTFSFQPGAGNTGPFVVQFLDEASFDGGNDDRLYVITSQTSFKLPKVVNDTFALAPGSKYYWRVMTHGVFANVDALADSTGFLDPFSGSPYAYQEIYPVGPRRGNGAFTISASQEITIAK